MSYCVLNLGYSISLIRQHELFCRLKSTMESRMLFITKNTLHLLYLMKKVLSTLFLINLLEDFSFNDLTWAI